MLRCGLLGQKLGHSYSPMIHGMLGDYEYSLYEKGGQDVEDFIKSGSWDCLNVTIPYKKTVFPYMKYVSETAKACGSINTVVRRPDGLYGYNTDVAGFIYALKRLPADPSGVKTLVLGSGGASAAVCAALDSLGAGYTVISRSGENNYGNISRHRDARLIVNATPVGMFPGNGQSPIDLSVFSRCEGVIDLIYNPARTALLMSAEKLGIPYVNGLPMLCAQAKYSSEIFTGKTIPDTKIELVESAVSSRQMNIVLIGMPGSGKTTLGRLISERTGRPFYDADLELEKETGISIPDFFEKYGEDSFRDAESRVLERLGKLSGSVISTGGGCVIRESNYACLHQNSNIVWIKRDLNALPVEGRPLSKKSGIAALYEKRSPLYSAFSDLILENNGTPGEALDLMGGLL